MAGYIGANTSSVNNNQNAAERRKKFTFTAATTSLTGLNFLPNKIHIFHNGIRLVKDTDFTEAADGKSVTLTSAAQAGDEVVAVTFAQDPASSSDFVSASTGGTFSDAVTIDSNGATALTVDRATSLGTIIDVQKDGTTVGNVGVEFTDNFFIGGNSSHSTIGFGTSSIYPTDGNSGGSDADTDLGSSGNRFKDLYLSSGVYLGGTGASNHLEDYEEGTWTPVHDTTFTEGAWNSTTSMSGNGHYTKVGNMVTCWWDGNVSGGSGNIAVRANFSVTYNSLPFAPSNSGNTHKTLGGYLQIYSAVGSGYIGHGSITPLASQSVFVVTVTALSYTSIAHTADLTLVLQYKI